MKCVRIFPKKVKYLHPLFNFSFWLRTLINVIIFKGFTFSDLKFEIPTCDLTFLHYEIFGLYEDIPFIIHSEEKLGQNLPILYWKVQTLCYFLLVGFTIGENNVFRYVGTLFFRNKAECSYLGIVILFLSAHHRP